MGDQKCCTHRTHHHNAKHSHAAELIGYPADTVHSEERRSSASEIDPAKLFGIQAHIVHQVAGKIRNNHEPAHGDDSHQSQCPQVIAIKQTGGETAKGWLSSTERHMSINTG